MAAQEERKAKLARSTGVRKTRRRLALSLSPRERTELESQIWLYSGGFRLSLASRHVRKGTAGPRFSDTHRAFSDTNRWFADTDRHLRTSAHRAVRSFSLLAGVPGGFSRVCGRSRDHA